MNANITLINESQMAVNGFSFQPTTTWKRVRTIIAGYLYLPPHKCTLLIPVGASFLPIQDYRDQIGSQNRVVSLKYL